MRKLALLFLACASFFKVNANAENNFYFSYNPYHVIEDEYDNSTFLGVSLGIKGKAEVNGYDIGVETYYTKGEEIALYGHAQYVFYPPIISSLKPYIGVGVSMPIVYIYKDYQEIYNNPYDLTKDIYKSGWNDDDFIFSVKSTLGFIYPLKALKGFVEASVMYPTVKGTDLTIYEKDNMKLPDAISAKVGVLF